MCIRDRDYLCIIEDQNDNIVAFGLAVPSLNQAMRKAKGKLIPFGWIPVLKALKGKKNPVLELFFVAVVEEYQNKGVNALLLNYITKNAVSYTHLDVYKRQGM